MDFHNQKKFLRFVIRWIFDIVAVLLQDLAQELDLDSELSWALFLESVLERRIGVHFQTTDTFFISFLDWSDVSAGRYWTASDDGLGGARLGVDRCLMWELESASIVFFYNFIKWEIFNADLKNKLSIKYLK